MNYFAGFHFVALNTCFFHSSDVKSKVAKTEEVVADSSQQVTSGALTGAEAYDPSYSSAAAYTAAASAYNYATPSQSQWAAYSAAHPVSFHSDGIVSVRTVVSPLLMSPEKGPEKLKKFSVSNIFHSITGASG